MFRRAAPLTDFGPFKSCSIDPSARFFGIAWRAAVFLFSLFFVGETRAASSAAVEAAKQADAERIAAIFAHDSTKLGAVLSEDLVYGQSDGDFLSKQKLLASVVVSKNDYDVLDYQNAQWQELAPTVVTMSAVASLKGARGLPRFSFRVLAIWREEGTTWKLFAYQSTRIPTTP